MKRKLKRTRAVNCGWCWDRFIIGADWIFDKRTSYYDVEIFLGFFWVSFASFWEEVPTKKGKK